MEVISAVSGGSIIAGLYYLKLKKLLEKYADPSVGEGQECLTPQCYVTLVAGVEAEFRKGVQRNIRTRVMSNLWKNFKMACANYSRSDRISELYNKHIYHDDNQKLSDLIIKPKGWPTGKEFKPDEHNHSREFKVPILLLNSTCLNTGHNWRCEAVRMGEPDQKQDKADLFDKNMRLERPIGWDVTPKAQQDFTLADAAAASACVPFLFHPLAVSDMYEPYQEETSRSRKETVRAQLVDGGVHDNLGVQALLDQKCQHLVVSDASGQMEDKFDPRTNVLSVVSRMNSILMDRVREEQLYRLEAERRGRYVLIDLRHGVERKVIRLLGSESGKVGVAASTADASPENSPVVPKDIQLMLSRVRTDLDSFSDLEAGALEANGYLITAKVSPEWLPKSDVGPTTESGEIPDHWWFSRTAKMMKEHDKRMVKQLKHSSKLAFKVFCLAPFTAISLTLMIYGGLAALIGWYFCGPYSGSWIQENVGAPIVASAEYWLPGCLGLLLLSWLLEVLGRRPWFPSFLGRWAAVILRILLRVVPSPLIFLVAWIHLHVFDRRYRNYGKLSDG